MPFPSAVRDASRLQARRARNPKRMLHRRHFDNLSSGSWRANGADAAFLCGCQSMPYPCTIDREDAAEEGTHFHLYSSTSDLK